MVFYFVGYDLHAVHSVPPSRTPKRHGMATEEASEPNQVTSIGN